MKICWDNLERISYDPHDGLFRKRNEANTRAYIISNCVYCGEECFVIVYGDPLRCFCDNECRGGHDRKPLEERRKNKKEYTEERKKFNHEHRKYRYINNREAVIHGKIKDRSRSKNLEFNLTKEWIKKKLSNGVCEATGLPLNLEETTSPFGPSTDRINSNKGYTKDNCRMVCKIFNMAKNVYTDEDVYKMSKGFVKNYEQRLDK